MSGVNSPRPGGGSAPYGGRALSVVMLFHNGIIFGLFFSLNRIVMEAGVPWAAYVTWQALGAGVLLLVVGASFRRLPGLSFAHLKGYFLVGLTGMVITWSISAAIAPKIPVGVFAIVMATIPLLTYILVLAIRIERFVWVRMGGLLLAFVGVLLLLIPEAGLPEPGMVGWVLFSLCAPLGLAVSTVLMLTMRPPESSSIGMSAGVMIVSGLCMLPIAAALGHWWFFDGPWSEAHWSAAGGIVVTAVMWAVAYELVKREGPVFFTFVDYIGMLTGIGWGILIFAERHSSWVWGSIALMLFAIYLVSKTGERARR